MRTSIWRDGSFPIYIDPDYGELLELAETKPDTLRICEGDEIVALASGYGNTHQSVTAGVRPVIKVRRWHPTTYILFHDGNGKWYMNPDGHFPANSERVELSYAYRYITPKLKNIIADFVKICDEKRLGN